MTKRPDSKTSQPAAALAEESYTRLHIAPLDPQLLSIIVTDTVLSKARGISYHTIQTFPDRPYGFINLPSADAEKIKRKLNGAVLKGAKIRIEPARPDDMPKPCADAVMDGAVEADSETKSKRTKSNKKDKKRKRDYHEIVGVELEEGRKVKRGWTVTPEEAKNKKKKERAREEDKSRDNKKEKKSKKKEPESQYTKGPECLVKTRLPPNKLDMVNGDVGSEKKKRSKKSKKHEVIVHEFKKTAKFPSFLRPSNNADTSGATLEFVEGKGWVDEKGTVMEEVKSTRPKTIPKTQVEKRKASATVADEETTSSSGSSSEDESEIDTSPEKHLATSSELKTLFKPTASVAQSSPTRPKSSSSTRSLTIKIPPAPQSSMKVHPLEALYKKQQQDEKMANTEPAGAEPFTFFGGHDDEDEEDDVAEDGASEGAENGAEEGGSPVGRSQGTQPPMTPFSKQDFEWRNTRSAAPTPDTAHPSRVALIWPHGREDHHGVLGTEDDEGYKGDMASPVENEHGDDAGDGHNNPATDFQKWFWEHRGDINRSWKKRRKMAAKEKRYRENRARADRAI